MDERAPRRLVLRPAQGKAAPARTAAGDRDGPSEAPDRSRRAGAAERSQRFSRFRSRRCGWRSASAAASICCTPRGRNPGRRLHRRRAVRERARQGGDRDRARGDPEHPALRPGCRADPRLAAAGIDRADRPALPRSMAEEAALEAPLRQPGQSRSHRARASSPAASFASPRTSRAMRSGRARRSRSTAG